ncbi:MAG TPA: biopolymer transporter Tol [Candidatus Kapabacteria bacterium]|nr:biopolymer transporter Tol [Candidatus Kapabacteria bacterium]
MRNIILFILLLIVISSNSAMSQFGKNKVQYQTFDWKYIQSPNFDIYYDNGSKYLAEFAAFSSEEALKSIQSTLNYKINKRIPIIVFNSHNEFQQNNIVSSYMSEGIGGVTELFKNRIVIPYQGDYAQFDHVIHHELVHGVLNDMFYGGTFQSAISSNSTFSLPLWMNEGFAEWESIGGMNAKTDMFMRDLVISENLPGLERLDGYLAYRGGQTFYSYVEDTYGKEKVGYLLNQLKIYKNLDIAFKNTFQLDFEDFSEKWQRDLKKFYSPDLAKYENPKDYATQITNYIKDRTYYNTSPAISPDGTKMAYISAPGGVFGVFVKKIDEKGEGEQLLSSSRSLDFEDLNLLTPGISWSNDASKLAISAKSGGEDAIYIVNVKDGDYEKYKFGMKSITSVSWSPDGKQFAFIGTIIEKSDIFLYDIATKKLMNITNDIFSEKHFTWSTDSKEIFFVSDRADYTNEKYSKDNFKMWTYNPYQSDIYKINIKDFVITRLTFDPENEKTSLAISKNNDLLYVSDKNGIGNIYKLNLNNNETKPITNSLTGITQISLARDDSKLLFTTQADGGFDIYMLRFPLEKILKVDELPLTSFKQSQNEKHKIIEQLKNNTNDVSVDSTTTKSDELISYGDFDVDFSSQKLVQPSIDAQQSANNGENTKLDSNTIFQEYDYKISFSPDLIAGNPGYSTYYGMQGITQMMFSDVMGDHQIIVQANLLIDLRNSQFFVAYNYLPNIIDYQFSAYHTSAFVLGYDNYFYRFRNFGTGVTASYPFSLFDRFEVAMNGMFLTKENVDVPQNQTTDKFLLLPSVRYVHDNTLWGYYGPREGSRYYFGISASPKLGNDGAGFSTFSTDIRQYFALGPYFSLAFRGAGAISLGSEPQNFFLGGTDNWINRQFNSGRLPFNDPVDFALMSFEMPLRGWAVNDVSGDKFFLVNAEFRFPLLTALVAGPLPILIQGINGAVFFDMGGAWYNDFNSNKTVNGELYPNNLLMSTGLGIRSYFLGLPVKIDIAWRNEVTRWSEPYWLFSLGYDF